MTRLKKELQKRNIIFEADEYDIYRTGIDEETKLVTITDKFLITVMYSNVLDPILYLYDRFTLEPIGYQDLYKNDVDFWGHRNPWCSQAYMEEDEEYDFELDDDYESNAFCDTTGFCGGTACSQYYKCTGLR